MNDEQLEIKNSILFSNSYKVMAIDGLWRLTIRTRIYLSKVKV